MADKGGGTSDDRRLGEFIRMQRQLADLSLRRMAELAQVSNAYLSQVERGLHQPSVRVLRAIAEALNISAETLLIQAGLLDADDQDVDQADEGHRILPTGDSSSAVSHTETAIRTDPQLLPEDREALIRIYRSLRRPPTA